MRQTPHLKEIFCDKTLQGFSPCSVAKMLCNYDAGFHLWSQLGCFCRAQAIFLGSESSSARKYTPSFNLCYSKTLLENPNISCLVIWHFYSVPGPFPCLHHLSTQCVLHTLHSYSLSVGFNFRTISRSASFVYKKKGVRRRDG